MQAVHDIGHAIAAKIHDVKLSLPLAVPSVQLGLFGTVTRFLTFPKSRKAIFDVAIAGPFAGFVASLTCILMGIDLTAHATPAELLNYPAIPTGFFDYSILLHEFMEPLRNIDPSSTADALGQSKTTLTIIHPLVAVGITGMFSNALNFLPIGRLDGGRVAMAIAGRRSANSISFAATLSQAVSLFSTSSPIPLFWGLFVILFQRGFDIPPEDDITPIVSDSEEKEKKITYFIRAIMLATCIILTSGMILPVPVDPTLQGSDGGIFGGLGGGNNAGTTGLFQGLQSLPPSDI